MKVHGRTIAILMASVVATVIGAAGWSSAAGGPMQDDGGERRPSRESAPRQQPAMTPQRVLQQVIQSLTTEAQEAKKEARFTHPDPDFAARFAEENPDLAPPTDLILNALVTQQSRDPFVDAYIRWQLTSFDPNLPAMSERSFLLLLNIAPAMVENPAADAGLINALRQAERQGALTPQTLAQIDQRIAQMKDQVLTAGEMNRPAQEWRDFIAKKLGDAGVMPRLAMVERLTAMIRAGWPVSGIKGDITRNFRASIEDDTFTAHDRQALVAEMRRFIGLQREYVHNVTIFAAGTIRPQIYKSSITSTNVENWHRALRGLR